MPTTEQTSVVTALPVTAKVIPPLKKEEVIRAAAVRLIEQRRAEIEAARNLLKDLEKKRDELRKKEAVAYLRKNRAEVLKVLSIPSDTGAASQPDKVGMPDVWVYPESSVRVSIPRSAALMKLETEAAKCRRVAWHSHVPTMTEAIRTLRAATTGATPEHRRVSDALKDRQFLQGIDAMLAGLGLVKPALESKS